MKVDSKYFKLLYKTEIIEKMPIGLAILDVKDF
jgi:hypothetical protein